MVRPMEDRTMKTSKQAKPAIDLDALADVLPHGSGIDGTWQFRENADGSVRCFNAWHAMSEHGYYCGWVPFAFTVRVASTPEAGKGPVIVAGPVRGGFKRASRANLYLDDLADVIGEQVDYALREAGSSVLKSQEGGAS